MPLGVLAGVVLASGLVGADGSPAAASGVPEGPCPVGAVCDTVAFVDEYARFHRLAGLDRSQDVTSLTFGNPGDVALLGDWDCDGTATPAMYRASDGFMYLRNSRPTGSADVQYYYGDPSDVPLAGDFDGDGCDTLAIYRPAEGRFYVKNSLGTGVADYSFAFGDPGDKPFVGDFDGDGVDTVGLHRESTGFMYFRDANSTGVADRSFFFGNAGDIVVAGDWDGDGDDTVAVYRRSSDKFYVKLDNRAGIADHALDVAGHQTALTSTCATSTCGTGTGPPTASASTTTTVPPPTTTTTTTVPPPPPYGDTLFGEGWEASLGADIPGVTNWVVVHVDRGHPAASDGNDGSLDWPLLTVQEGLGRAHQAKVNGLAARVLVHPGTYRESLTIAGGSASIEQPVLRLEAVVPGTAVISGSEVWAGWERVGTTDVSSHDWPYDWGLAAIPSGYESQIQDIVRRLEMVFVDGIRLDQVLSYGELVPGSFYVAESEDRLYVYPSGAADLGARFVEVAVRHDLLRVNDVSNFVLDGFVFEHANQPFGTSAAQIADSRNVEIVNVTARWNNWTGFGLWNTSEATLRDSSASSNGGGGMELSKVRRARFESIGTHQSNWRGASGGFVGWSIAGMKGLWMHDVIIAGHRSENNASRGMWLDTNNERVLIDAPRWCDNELNGFFLEVTQGPVVVKDALICHNNDAGVLGANATDFTLLDSTICANGASEILISGEEPTRSFTDPDTGQFFSIPPGSDWTISGTTILDHNGTSPLIHTWLGQSAVDEFLSTITADENTWWHGNVGDPFWFGGSTTGDFNTWAASTGQGSNSTYTHPGPTPGC